MALQQYKDPGSSTYLGYNPDTQEAIAFSNPDTFNQYFGGFEANAPAPTFDTSQAMATPDRFVSVSLNPSTTTNTNTLSSTPVTTQDINSLITENQKFQQQVLGYMTPTPEETKAQTDLDTLDASFQSGIDTVEDKVIPMPFITGQSASLEKRYLRERDVAVKNLSRLQTNRQNLLNTANAQVGFTTQNIATQLQIQQFAQQEQAAALKFALDNNVTKPYFLIGTTVYDTGSGNPFTSEQDFLTKTGMTVGQAGAQGLIQTEFETDADRQYNLEKAKLEQGKWMSVTDPITGGSVLINPSSGQILDPFGTGSIPGVPGSVSALQQEFNAVITDLSKDQRQSATRTFNSYVNSGNIEAAEAYIDKLALQSLTADQKRDYEAYDNAVTVTTTVLSDMERFKSTNFGPWKSAIESKKPWVGLQKDQNWVGIYQQIAFAQAELKRALYGTALTATEKGDADKLVITDNDDMATVQTKLEGLNALMRQAKARVLNHAKGDFGPSNSTFNILENDPSNPFNDFDPSALNIYPGMEGLDFGSSGLSFGKSATRTFTPKKGVEKVSYVPVNVPQGSRSLAVKNPAPYGVIAGFDITNYATDPTHERKVFNIYKSIPPFTYNNPMAMDVYIQQKAKGSPVKAKDVMDAAKTYNVDANLMLALMLQDSTFGTRGKAVRTRNPGNVGNTDSGATQGFRSWRDGVFAVARNLSKRRVKVIKNT